MIEMTDAEREQYEERSAICEFMGGLSREEAEAIALEEILWRRDATGA